MKQLTYFFIAIMVIGGVLAAVFAPDMLSIIVVVAMMAFIVFGIMIAIAPLIRYIQGLQSATQAIYRTAQVQSESAWHSLSQTGNLFGQKILNQIFREYIRKVNKQQEAGQIISDIEDYINSSMIALRTWRVVVAQIPSSLTGLGILGTFVGLIYGIRNIGFSSVSAALTSVQELIQGIDTAFYTSIIGVIFSILFNIVYRMSWNMMLRELGLFTEEFHRYVIPTVEEQERYLQQSDLKKIITLLERLPKKSEFSTANPGGAETNSAKSNEQILMPQIISGMQNGEFEFYLQPRYDLNTREIVGAESLMRWNHPKLGLISPSVFIPIVEKNGYIIQLDKHMWDNVCRAIRRWIDEGRRPVPISLNVTKTDILALDVVSYFESLTQKYGIPPRNLQIEIAQNAYYEVTDLTVETEKRLRKLGFHVLIDGFNGNFVALTSFGSTGIDAVKIDLRYFDESNTRETVASVCAKAKELRIPVYAEGIENMSQLTSLRKLGCNIGQGFYFSKPLPVKEFLELQEGNNIVEAKKQQR